MLLDVWKNEEVAEIGEFAEYLWETWVNSDLCNWHEGTTTNCANTNGLESTNKRIKADFLTRTVQAFEPFLQDVDAILSYWSIHLRVNRVYHSTKFNGPFYECSCQKGCRKNVCKHAVMAMCTQEKIYEYSVEALAKPMKHSRRSSAKQIGRPALSQKQNRFAVAD